MLVLQLGLNGLQTGLIYALTAAGFSLIFGMTKIFHAAHGATFLVASYAYYHASSLLGLPWWISVGIAAVAAMVFGVGFYMGVYRLIQRSEASFFTVFIAAFGAVIVMQNVISMVYGRSFQVVQTPLSRSREILPDLFVSPMLLVAIGSAGAAFFAVHLILKHTTIGIGVRALADNPELVRTFGMDPVKLSLFVFLLGSLLVVPAAVLTTHISGVSPGVGHHIVMISIAATIVGGIGSLTGAALAGILLGLAENLSLLLVGPQWAEAVTFLVLFLFIIIRPSGFSGRILAN